MEESISQLALISSVLGGFSFMFLSTILITEIKNGKVEFWMLLFLMIASMSFLLTALGWSMMSFAEKEAGLLDHHQFLVRLFLLGLITNLIALGLSGWIKNRKVGIMTGVVSLIGLLVLIFQILSRYITL